MEKIIKIELANKEYSVKMYDNQVAKNFVALGAFIISVSSSGGHHYWGGISKRLSTVKGLETSEPNKGMLVYEDHLQGIAVFYDYVGRTIAPYVVYPMGEVVEEEQLSELKNAGSRITFKVKG